MLAAKEETFYYQCIQGSYAVVLTVSERVHYIAMFNKWNLSKPFFLNSELQPKLKCEHTATYLQGVLLQVLVSLPIPTAKLPANHRLQITPKCVQEKCSQSGCFSVSPPSWLEWFPARIAQQRIVVSPDC